MKPGPWVEEVLGELASRRWPEGRRAVGIEREGDEWVVFDGALIEIARRPTAEEARVAGDAYVEGLGT